MARIAQRVTRKAASEPYGGAVRAISSEARATSSEARATSTDQIYHLLRQKILDSDMLPGANYLEQELAVMLGVSRTPVREALIRLQADNLVQVIPRHGIKVLPLAPSDMKEIYEVVMGLEPMAAARVAAMRPSEAALRPMVKACSRMTAAIRSGDVESWIAADDDFHSGIVALCDNARLIGIITNCADQVHRARRFTIKLRPHPDPQRSIREHKEILDAIRAGDAKAAAARSYAHRERGWSEQLKVLTEFGIRQV
ncbi:MAG: GntR family transcriptional regulator [Bradyrhizobium sp.]|uniref:GntR family transcriptional regulator n=1 Tax=Bradyrhizobium sp. TaxID=376 RepID=UPI001D224AEB|nr:GntR family transcriptional regulator [Bradyrhizobium sp.]MBV9560344.1 GntR family transcriptional regulator [Bradyrhizobium sp.]